MFTSFCSEILKTISFLRDCKSVYIILEDSYSSVVSHILYTQWRVYTYYVVYRIAIPNTPYSSSRDFLQFKLFTDDESRLIAVTPNIEDENFLSRLYALAEFFQFESTETSPFTILRLEGRICWQSRSSVSISQGFGCTAGSIGNLKYPRKT